MAAAIDFYFEFSSPYGYYGSACIDEVATRYGRAVHWRPMLLGAAMKITGSRPLVNMDAMRQPYFNRDIERSAGYYGVPYTRPDVLPTNSVAACRAYYWLYDQDAGLAKKFAQQVYHHYFGTGHDISPPEVVADIAAGLGAPREGVVAALQDQAVKDRVRAETDAAIGRGVFGSPFFIVDGEPFWGADRLDHVERWLKTGGW